MYHHNYPPNVPPQQATGGFVPPISQHLNMPPMSYQMSPSHQVNSGHHQMPYTSINHNQMPPPGLPPPQQSNQMMPPASNYQHPDKLSLQSNQQQQQNIADSIKQQQQQQQQMYMRPPLMQTSGKPVSYQQQSIHPSNIYPGSHQLVAPGHPNHPSTQPPQHHHLSMQPNSYPPPPHPYHQTPVSMHQQQQQHLNNSSSEAAAIAQQQHAQQQHAHYHGQMPPNSTDYSLHMRPPTIAAYSYPPNGSIYNKYPPTTNLPNQQQQIENNNLSTSQNDKLNTGLFACYIMHNL